ncbi:hypothetical protein AZE42_07262 [Rhizopogon vesiculosus]|uniref:Uncharacterized protein n=1 Tax=Rhizopogon vesiculosus TaxID=180088 RepID=A0A1J8QB35_9AGAM|nr:hypothetical protein AZE42_07262 [Rhizopogon vesiculosus]
MLEPSSTMAYTEAVAQPFNSALFLLGTRVGHNVHVAAETKQTIETESLDGQTLQASSGLSRYRM